MQTELRWYALQVMTGREEEIAQVIRSKSLAAPIVPVRILKERRQGKPVTVRRTLFPGYVFLHWTGSIPSYYELLGIPCVIRFVGMSPGRPSTIPDEQMAPVLVLANQGNPIGLSQIYREGGKTRIRSGPLQDLEAYIIRIDPRNLRATIQIPLLTADHTVQLGLEMLEPTTIPESTQADPSP